MKPLHPAFRFAALFVIVLASCGRSPNSESTEDQPATPSVVPVNLGGPEMAIGSTWLYADGTVLVAVPAGIFTMGGGRADNLAHEVNLPEYWIYSTEVTNAQYAHCVATGACTPPYGPDNPGFGDYLHANDPVVGVDHAQATAYCEFVHARLPTEAEWEKAARGPEANIYPWGEEGPSCALLNFGTCFGKATPVNSYPEGRSVYGAFDMAGNSLEWVADWYRADYYAQSPADDPQGPESGVDRSVRSSAFNSGSDQTPAFIRSFSRPEIHRDNLGFRCVVDDPQIFAPYCEYPGVYGTDGIGGGAAGPQVSVTCPLLAIEQTPGCVGNQPVTTIQFSGHENWGTTAISVQDGGCTSLSPLTCTADGTVRVCAFCKAEVRLPAQCPAGYQWDPNQGVCVGAGTPGICLPGSTYDPAGQCCVVQPGTPAPVATPVAGSKAYLLELLPSPTCPAGTWRLPISPSEWACVALPVQAPYCVEQGIVLDTCTPGGGDGDDGGGGCAITDASCASSCSPYGYIYDPAACSCNCLPG